MKDRLKDHLEGWQFCENCGITYDGRLPERWFAALQDLVSTTFHTIHTTMLSVHISHWLMTVLIAVSYSTGGYLYFFRKCFTILRILARAVSFFCRSITLALLNFCVSSHLRPMSSLGQLFSQINLKKAQKNKPHRAFNRF